MVGLQAVQVRASLWRAIVKVVVDHVVHDVAAQPTNKHRHTEGLGQRLTERHIEQPHHYGGQPRRKDEPRAVEWRLERNKMQKEKSVKRAVCICIQLPLFWMLSVVTCVSFMTVSTAVLSLRIIYIFLFHLIISIKSFHLDIWWTLQICLVM